MDRILVATDFSTRSDRALRRATLIAKQVDAVARRLRSPVGVNYDGR
jgi:nucleotide-binding universal stress UspA family protein